MNAHRRLWGFLLVAVVAAAVGAATAARASADTGTTVTGTTTCTFDPQPGYYGGVTDQPGPLKAARTRCDVWTVSTTWNGATVCLSGRLIQFGISVVTFTIYLYDGRAIVPQLDGVTVPTPDVAEVVLPGARQLPVLFAPYGHAGPVGRDLGAC